MIPEEQPTRSDIALRWLHRISFVLAVFMAGSAVGFSEGATYVVREVESRFECVQK